MTPLTKISMLPGQGTTPIVSGLAGRARLPNIRSESQSQSQMRKDDVTVTTDYHNTVSETQRPDTGPRAFNAYASRALDPASSAPIADKLRDSGHINLYAFMPSTAPVFAPGSLIPSILPQKVLAPCMKEANPNQAAPFSKHAPVGKPKPITLKPESGQEKQAQVPMPGQSLQLDTATAHTAHYVSNAVGEGLPSPAAIKQVRAEDIDTQTLLDKAAARRLLSTKDQKHGTVARVPAVLQHKGKTAFPKRRRSLRCTHCRTKRIRCGFNEGNPEGACQPCLDASIPCSFAVAANDVAGVQSTAHVKPVVQVPNSQETAVNGPQGRRLSLRSRDVQPINLTTELVSQEIPSEELKQVKGMTSMVPSKRSSQLAMAAPKRLKSKETDQNRMAPNADCNAMTKEQRLDKLGQQAKKSQQAVQELSNVLRDLRSDATTATVDTLDLDPPDKLQKVARNSTPPRPLYSELSASTGQTEPADQENLPPPDGQGPKSITRNSRPLVTTTGKSAFDLPLAELTNLDMDARNTWLDEALIEVLQDDSFIPFCKTIDSRWERHMFDFKL